MEAHAWVEAYPVVGIWTSFQVTCNHPQTRKIKEEINELEAALKKNKKDEVVKEVGDLFFAMSNVSRLLDINPEVALREANKKFARRFRFIEEKLQEEVKEFINDSSESEIVDILEVINEICNYKGYDKDKIEELRKEKAEKRGAFKERIILDEVT